MSEDREQSCERDFARGMREFDVLAAREIRPMIDYLRGRWSTTCPTREGAYCMRVTRDGKPHVWVMHFDAAPQSKFTASDELEFFHLVDGRGEVRTSTALFAH